MLSKPTVIFSALLVIFCASQLVHAEPVTDVSEKRFVMTIDGQSLSVPIYSNHDIDKASKVIDRVVIAAHGAGRNGPSETRLTEAAKKLQINDSTLIVLPQFLMAEDIEKHKVKSDVLFWNGGWREGDFSVSTEAHTRPARISSYVVIQRLLEHVLSKNPNVKHMVFTGHSAGAQIIQRFAAGSAIDDALNAKGIQIRYVLSNPSSYLYFDKRRRVGEALDKFAEPSADAIKKCPTFDAYKLGLEGLNEFMAATGAEKLRANYAKRDIVYLLSAEDNDPKHVQLERTCGAMMQGEHRLQRGTIHFNYASANVNDAKVGKKTLVVVPGFAHTSNILASACGTSFIFDKGDCAHVKATSSKP